MVLQEVRGRSAPLSVDQTDGTTAWNQYLVMHVCHETDQIPWSSLHTLPTWYTFLHRTRQSLRTAPPGALASGCPPPPPSPLARAVKACEWQQTQKRNQRASGQCLRLAASAGGAREGGEALIQNGGVP